MALRTPLHFSSRLTFLNERTHAEMMEWLAQGKRWIITFVGSYGRACIAQLHTPNWTSRHGVLAQLYEDDALDPWRALTQLNQLAPRHAIVLCGYDHERGQVAVLDPFHDGAPRPVWIDEEQLDRVGTGNYYYPTAAL